MIKVKKSKQLLIIKMEDCSMKKLVVLVAVAMFYLAGYADSPSASWYVSSGEPRISCEKINLGISNARIVLENGEKITVPFEKLSSYSLDGNVYEKKMVYLNGKPTGKMSYMRLIKSHNGYNLYESNEFVFESVDPLQSYKRFYVYKGDDFHLALNEESLPSVFNFFGVKWSYV
jgi:hypothetical protein